MLTALPKIPLLSSINLDSHKMKKGIALLLICLFAVVGIYTFIDIIESVFNVARYETFTLAATGTLFGKAVFLLVVIVAFTFSIKFYRKN